MRVDGSSKAISEEKVDSYETETKRKRYQSATTSSRAHTSRSETSQCPHCQKTMLTKSLSRHIKDKHASDFERFKCDFCSFVTSRQHSLLGHQQRMHMEPIKLGRPKKREKPPRKRSPFRMETFNDRHRSSIQHSLKMKEELQRNSEQLKDVLYDNEKNEKRIKCLEDAKSQSDNEFRKMKTRLSIIECKEPKTVVPDLRNIPALLKYFNLTNNSSKEDIRKMINLRLMEISPESLISKEIFSQDSVEEKQKLTIFFNQASDVLKKWRKSTPLDSNS